MSCEICGRNSCTRSFHSLREQEAFDSRQGMSSDVEELRIDLQNERAEAEDLRTELASLRELAEVGRAAVRVRRASLRSIAEKNSDASFAELCAANDALSSILFIYIAAYPEEAR